MARLQFPAQNLDIEVPDEGLLFRGVPGNSEEYAFVRRGRDLVRISGSLLPNFQDLPQINPSSEGLDYLRRFGGQVIAGSPADIPGRITGEILTSKPSPVNPHAATLDSSAKGALLTPISTAEQAARFGASPALLTSLQSTRLPTGGFAPGIPQQTPTATFKDRQVADILGGIKNVKEGLAALTSESLAKREAPTLTKSSPTSLPNISSISVTEPAKSTTTNTFTSQLEELQARLEGRETKTRQKIDEATGSFEKELLEVNKQIREKQAEALELEKRAEARTIPLPFIEGEIALGKKQLAIDTLRLSAIAEALQGNIALAEKRAKTAIDVEFAEIERQIRDTRANLIANYDNLTPTEQKQADITLLQINNNDAFVQAKKQEKKEIASLVNNAIKDGMRDLQVIEQAQQADSLEEAQRIIVEKMPSANKFEQRFDAVGNLVEYELDRQGQVVGEKILSREPAKVNGGASSRGVKITPEDSRTLIGAGFGSADIQNMQADINKYGLQTVLDGITDPNQKAAVQKIYGQQVKEPAFLTKNYFQQIFTEDQLKSSAKEAGYRKWYTMWATEKENYLNYLMGLVEQYRKAGYSDKEILKLMQ